MLLVKLLKNTKFRLRRFFPLIFLAVGVSSSLIFFRQPFVTKCTNDCWITVRGINEITNSSFQTFTVDYMSSLWDKLWKCCVRVWFKRLCNFHSEIQKNREIMVFSRKVKLTSPPVVVCKELVGSYGKLSF